MARSVFSEREVAGFVDETVTAYRNRGHGRTLAIELAAAALGMTARRVKAIIYGEPISGSVEEFEAIHGAYMRHLDDEERVMLARIEALKAKRRNLENAHAQENDARAMGRVLRMAQ